MYICLTSLVPRARAARVRVPSLYSPNYFAHVTGRKLVRKNECENKEWRGEGVFVFICTRINLHCWHVDKGSRVVR